MKIKVCGMRNKENLKDLVQLQPDFIGFIFYDKSKRFVSDFPDVFIPKEIKKTGVFVNESFENMQEIIIKYDLDAVQLHGEEAPDLCARFKNVDVIKAFSVDDDFNFEKTKQFEDCCSYFLFDTKGDNYGGNGTKFNWEVLKNYKGNTPFLLSGGIRLSDSDDVKFFNHPLFIGVDINSGFEKSPGFKNIEDIKLFKTEIL